MTVVWASRHEELVSTWVVAPPVAPTWLSLLSVWCFLGATPWGQPWTPAWTLPHGRDGCACGGWPVWWMFCRPSMCCHVRRNAGTTRWPALTPIAPTTACHQGSSVETYRRDTGYDRLHAAPE